MCTSQYHHCEHESDIQGSKYPMRRSETHTPKHSGGTIDGEVRTFLHHLPVGRRVVCKNIHKSWRLHMGELPVKDMEGIRPSARGHLFSVSLEDHARYWCQSHCVGDLP